MIGFIQHHKHHYEANNKSDCTGIIEYVTKTKWKRTGLNTRTQGSRWTITVTEWQVMEGVRSVGRPKCYLRDDIMGQLGVTWTKEAKDRESWGTGGGLLPVMEGHGLE